MAFCTVLSASVQGLGVEMIRVEADVSNGLPISVFGSERGIRTGENSNPQFGDETSGKEDHCQSCAGNCPEKRGIV